MKKIFWDEVKFHKVKFYFTVTPAGINFINNPNTGISNIYNFYPKLDAEFKLGDTTTKPYRKELAQYLSGKRTTFDLPVDIDIDEDADTQRIYQLIQQIPYGTTTNLIDFCKQHELDTKQVKKAILTNPLIIWIPTHRIVGIDYAASYRKVADLNYYLIQLEQSNY